MLGLGWKAKVIGQTRLRPKSESGSVSAGSLLATGSCHLLPPGAKCLGLDHLGSGSDQADGGETLSGDRDKSLF